MADELAQLIGVGLHDLGKANPRSRASLWDANRMDEVLVEVYRDMVLQFRCSADDILETPKYREHFLSATGRRLGAAHRSATSSTV